MAADRSQQARVKDLEKKVIAANKIYDNWSEDFDTAHLEQYYKGIQWRGVSEDVAKKLYVINFTFAGVEVNKPSLVFDRPQVRVQPRVTRQEDAYSKGKERACLAQDIIQTYIEDSNIDFDEETALCVQEAHFRFGVIRVGYGANYIENPDAGMPVLGPDDQPMEDENGPVKQPEKIPQNEEVYVRRIPAHTFRVSRSNKNKLTRNDWVGYYEWHRVEDLKANPAYSNTANLKATGVTKKSLQTEGDTLSKDEIEKHHGMCKVWFIWHLRGRTHDVFVEGHNKFLVEGEAWTFLPFAVLRFHPILDAFYPVPPVSQWMSAQDEINETRDAQRAHRRRFYRRYVARKNFFDPDEKDKFETGGDGVVCETDMDISGIKPIEDAPMSGDSWRTLDLAKTDFATVSSIGGEQRGVAESDTATQATIIDQRSRIRESYARTKVAKWLSRISRLILLTVKENMTDEIFVKRFSDPWVAPNGDKVIAWQQIKAEDLGDTDFDIFIDLASMSPVAQEQERSSWNNVLVLIANPGIQFLFATSETILRKTLYLYGIRSETEILEIQSICKQAIAAAQQATAMAALTGGKPGMGGPAGIGTPAGAPTVPSAGGEMMTPDKLSGMLGAASQAGGY